MKTDDRIIYLCGNDELDPTPMRPFDEECLSFLGALSLHIRKLPRTMLSDELRSFAFWLRPSNLQSMAQRYKPENAIGLGISFHIAPANVPLMFAYTCAIGLLAGNACRVRVSGRRNTEAELICSLIRRLLDGGAFPKMQKRIAILTYDNQYEDITERCSRECDARIIWGGDRTVEAIRKIPMKASAVELVMPDRTSISVLQAEAVASLTDEALCSLANLFYNDTYGMDQNACSCPEIIFWQEDDINVGQAASDRFWNALAQAAGRYPLSEIKVSQKYGTLFECAIALKEIKHIKRWENLLYVTELADIPEDLSHPRMQFGSFLEYHMKDRDDWTKAVSERTQTLTYYGVDEQALRETVLRRRLRGVHRIVPVGQALWMDLVWDGKNLIRQLSRTVY